MTTSIRSCLSSGVAVIGVSGLVLTAVMPQQGFVEADDTAVALTAQVQPLPQPAIDALTPPLDLIGRQATFHVELFVDFVVTGAELFGRIPPIAGTLLQDIQNGTPLPTAVGRALLDFAEVEFDAGRELVGFAADWANFQIQFLRDLIAGLPSGPVGHLLTATLDVASQIVEGVVEFSDAVIDGAEAVLTGGPAATAPARAVTSTAAPSPPRQTLRTIRPQVAESVDVTPTQEASEESGVESEEGAEDGPVGETRAAKQPRLPRAIAEIRNALTAQGEVRNNPADTTDPDDATTAAADDTGHAGPSDAGPSKTTKRAYSRSAQRRSSSSPGGW